MTAIPAAEPRIGPKRLGAMQTIRRGLRLSPELRRGLPGTLVLALLATAGRVVVPVVIQQILDRGFDVDTGVVDLDLVTLMVALGGVAILATGTATAWMHIRLARVSETALSGLRIRAFGHIHDLSMLHQASEQRGVLVSRVTSDIDEISRFMQWAGLQILVNFGQAILALVVMLIFSWRLALVVVVLVPFIALVIKAFQGRLDRAFSLVREKVARMLGVLAEAVVGAQVIRAYGAERRTRERLGTAVEEHRSSAVRAGALSATFSGVGELMSSTVIASVMIGGTLLAVRGYTSPGTVVAFLFLAQLFVEPVQAFGEAINEAQTAVAGWRRVLDVLDIAPDVADPGPDGAVLPHEPLGASFEDVSFRYPRSGEIASDASGLLALRDVNVAIEPESKVAIVGETGSGKTTFAKLLTRLMDASEGCVRIGGVPVKDIQFGSLRERVVMVPQDGSLFAGTIADNVRMGRPDATDADVVAALEHLGLSDWLGELRRGVLTQVGERGNALSAGERQLVALARAYVADPDLLVLDEATSAVDPATEVRIQRALAGLTAGRTTVTIAHRLSTAEAADRVLVFDRGELVEDGTHDELKQAGEIYSRLHESWESGKSA
jgi:putative ABC transport system ATP-binding protein